MSKLYKLKEWFSLEDTATRLSSGLGEPVSTLDVLQLIVEGHLPLSWYARHVPAERVGRACMLHYLVLPIFGEFVPPNDYEGSVMWRGDWAVRRHKGLKEGDILMPYATLDWMRVRESRVVERLDGVFRLELTECGALKEWVHSLLTDTGGELISLEGYFVSDSEGAMWRILEHNSGGKIKLPDGTIKRMESFHHPSGAFPDSAELVIRRSDIKSFEGRITEGNQSSPTAISPRERETLLNIAGGLLDLLLGRSPGGKPQSVFESQAAIIDALLARHEDKPGITRRTLEDKFAQAKRNLKSS